MPVTFSRRDGVPNGLSKIDEKEDDDLPPPQDLPNPAATKLTRRTSKIQIGPFGQISMSSLIQACAEGNLDGVEGALAALDSPEMINQDRDAWAGSTAIHWAAYTGNAAVVNALLCAKADPRLTNKRYTEVALHLAARYNRTTAVVGLLVEAAPDSIELQNAKGNTPLHEAAYEGRAHIVEELLKRGANIEACNDAYSRGGLTPLLAAAEYGHASTVRLLLDWRADATTAPLQSRQMRSLSAHQAGLVGQLPSSSFAQGRAPTSSRLLASGRRASTHHRIDLVPASSDLSDLYEFRLPGHGALSVTITAGQLNLIAPDCV